MRRVLRSTRTVVSDCEARAGALANAASSSMCGICIVTMLAIDCIRTIEPVVDPSPPKVERPANTSIELLPAIAEYVPRDWNTVEIVLERTTCYGACPAYTLRIHGDGEVDWNGLFWVDVMGEARRCIERADVERLLCRFSNERFFDLESSYTDGTLDMPATVITLTIDGRTMHVHHEWTSREDHEWLAREFGSTVDQALMWSLERLDALAAAIDDAGGAAWWRGRIRTWADEEAARR